MDAHAVQQEPYVALRGRRHPDAAVRYLAAQAVDTRLGDVYAAFGQDDVNGLGGIGEGKVLVAEQVIRRLGHDGEKRGNAQEKRAENRKETFHGERPPCPQLFVDGRVARERQGEVFRAAAQFIRKAFSCLGSLRTTV